MAGMSENRPTTRELVLMGVAGIPIAIGFIFVLFLVGHFIAGPILRHLFGPFGGP